MTDITFLTRFVAGVARNINIQNNTLVVGSLKVGETFSTELTKQILDRLIPLQSGINLDESYHVHDALYYRKSELNSTSDGSPGASIIGIDQTPNFQNFTPDFSNVQSALEAIDEKFSSVGTVTSVDIAVPTDILSVSGNPITVDGVITLTKVDQDANKVFAGPETGSADEPTFRSLVLADLPTLTKDDVGLNNVDNTSDLDKPISTATQDALDDKYDASNPAAYVNAAQAAAAAPVQSVAGRDGDVVLTKSDVGLSNVDNTSDLNKPISTATQTALNSKYDSSNPAAYVNAAQAAAAAPVQSVAGRTGSVTLTKSDVGLSNVDNTSDLNKPISTATQDALDDKYDASNPAGYVNTTQAAAAAPVQSVAGRTGSVTLTKSDVGLSNVPNVDATNPANITQSTSYRFVTDAEKSTWNGKQDALGFTPENIANKGQANGYAPLNASSKIDNSYLDTNIMNYHGTWDASTNTPALADGMVGADPGDIYVVSVSGTRDLGSGSIVFNVGDWVIYSQTNTWEHVDNTSAVTSVNGAQGAVTVDAINQLTGDITAGPASGSESKAATISNGVITDAKISASAAISDTKLATISTTGKVSNSATTATDSNTASTIVARDASGNFSAGTITATLSGNASTATSATSAANLTGSNLTGDVTNIANATTVASVGGKTASAVAQSVNATTAATTLNTANTIVKRDSNGDFSAGTITATLSGNASTATTATNFSGSLSGDVTGTQSATTISASTVTGKPLTGFVSNPGIVTSTDSILHAIEKLDGNTNSKEPAITTLSPTKGGLGTDASSFTGVVKSSSGTFSASTIVNADVSNSAAIAVSKLASGTNNQVLQTISGVPTWSTLPSGGVESVNGETGDVTVNAINQLTGDITAGPASGSESKAATIAAGAVNNSKIATNANIAVSKLASGTDGQILKTVAGVPTWSADTGGGGGIGSSTETVASYGVDWLSTEGATKAVNHNLATEDVMVQVFDKATGESIEIDTTTRISNSSLTLTSTQAPSAGGWRVLVIARVGSCYAPSDQVVASYNTNWLAADGLTKVVTHGIGTKDVVVQIFNNFNHQSIEVDSIVRTTDNSITLTSTEVPGIEGWRVLVIARVGVGYTPTGSIVASYSTDWLPNEGLTKTANHNLATEDVMVHVFDKNTNESIEVDTITRISDNSITLTSNQVPAGHGWRVLVIAQAGANYAPVGNVVSASAIMQDSTHRFVTDIEKAAWSSGSLGYTAENIANKGQANGYAPLNGSGKLENSFLSADFTNPANITQSADYRFVTDAEKTTWNSKQDFLLYTPENIANKGQANGYAPLNGSGKLENSFLSTDFTNPANITQSSDYRFVTDTEKSTWNGKEDTANKGQANGYAPLNASSKIDNVYLETNVMNYHGTWDVLTNTPSLADGMVGADPGDIYVVSVGGTRDLGSGDITFSIGDWVIYSQTSIWERVNNTSTVTSVNGAFGSVTVNAISELTGDITAGPASGSESKAATIAAGAVDNSKISASANIAVSKLAAGTDGQVLKTVSGVPTWSAESGGGGGAAITDPSELSVDAATRLGYKQYFTNSTYNNGITVQILTDSTDPVFATVSGTLIPYKTNSGTWRLKGNTNSSRFTDFYYTLQGNNKLNTPFNDTILAIAKHSNDRVIVAGNFTIFNGLVRNRIVRLNSDGTEDVGFYSNLNEGFNDSINSVVVQSDNKILIGGAFTSFYNGYKPRLLRLNADGNEDTNFAFNLGTGFENGAVKSIAVQSDGKILVGGTFTTFQGQTRNRLVRLNSDGSEDTVFYNNMTNNIAGDGLNGDVNAVASFGGNFVLAGGTFTSYTGSGGTVTRNRLISFTNTGTENTSFYTNLGTAITNGQVNTIFVGDQIYVGGSFTTFNGQTRNRIIKLSTGGFENSGWYFNTNGFNDAVNIIKEGSNGYLFGGKFTQLGFGTKARGLAQILFNGGNTTFTTNLGEGFIGGEVFAVAKTDIDSSVFAGGNFTHFNTRAKRNLVKVSSSGTEANIPKTLTFTIPGVVFNTNNSFPQLNGIDNTAIVSNGGWAQVSGSDMITASYYPESTALTFDLPLASPPTWAYIDPPPQATAAVYSNFSPTNGEVEVTWTGTADSWETQSFDGTIWQPDNSGSIGLPSPQVLASFSRPLYSEGDKLYRIRLSNGSGAGNWIEFTVEKEAFSSVTITGLNVTYPTDTTANISMDYTIIAPATATYYILHRFEGGAWSTVVDGSPSSSPIEILNIDRPNPGTSTLYKITISASDSTSDEYEFIINEAALAPIIGFAGADSNYNGTEALLNVTYQNGATQYQLEYYDDMSSSWIIDGGQQTMYPPVDSPTGPFYKTIARYGSGPTQYRISVANAAGWSLPSNSVSVFRNLSGSTPPSVWNANPTYSGSNFNVMVSYTYSGSMPNLYEIQFYNGPGSYYNGYSDVDPNNWAAAGSGSITAMFAFTTDLIARPAQTTLARVRVGSWFGGDTYSTWYVFEVTSA